MNLRKRAVEGTAVAMMAVMLCGAAQTAQAVPVVKEVTADSQTVKTVETELATNGTAGIVASMNQVEENALTQIAKASVSVKAIESNFVATAEAAETESEVLEEMQAEMGSGIAEEVSAEAEGELVEEVSEEAESNAEEVKEESELTEEEQLWQTRLMAEVNEFLYVRASADENAEIVGKMYKGDVAEIVETGDGWTLVQSGNVEGYVHNDYVVTGQEAFEYATANVDTSAEVQTNGLRIRSEASEEASVVTVVSEGTDLQVDTSAEASEEWVAVNYGGSTRYVSAEYVDVELELGEAVTIEEEQEELRRLAEEEAARKAAQVTEVTTVQNEAVTASVDDVTLLAAIIQCEAGGECYEGQLAVGAVVMNRVRSAHYPSTISEVIYQRGQFGPAGSGKLSTRIANGVKDSCLQAAQEAINGVDNTGGATKFRGASSGHAGVVIGNHVFF